MMMGDGSGQLVTNTQYPNRRCGHSCCCPSTQSALHFLRDILGTIVNIILSIIAFISVLELYKKSELDKCLSILAKSFLSDSKRPNCD